MNRENPVRELIVDSFAGGGGASLGIFRALGRCPDVAINHDAAAIAMHRANHPGTRHFTEDVFKAAPRRVTKGRPVGLLWASPDCRHHSRAKGSKPVEKRIRGLAWAVVKWAVEASPRVIILENVREFEDWGPVVPRWVCKACGWKGTEGQARLVRSRRRCPRCDSLRLAETADLIPCPARKGLTFRKFAGRLRNLGYEVRWKVLNAADYGAPTHRRRLFLVARNDGQPVVWPVPTHGDPKKVTSGADLFGPPLKPWRTAAECIDWSIPCPSIFDRKKPLAEKTLRRIALGIKRYVLDNPRPFLVDMQRENRSRGTDEPMGTVTTQDNRYNLVTPVVARIGQTGSNGGNCGSVTTPITTITSKAEHLLVSPVVVPVTHAGERRANGPEEPLPTVTGANRGEQALIAPVLARQFGRSTAASVEAPVGTTTAGGKGKSSLIVPHLTKFHENSVGSAIDEPTPTVTANSYIKRPGGSVPIGVVSAFLAKHFGGVVGHGPDRPLGTVTAVDHHSVVAANLVHMRHGGGQHSGAEEPLPTVTGQGNHAALVYSFLTKYFGTGGQWQATDEPLHTATGKARFGLVTVTIEGEPYVIVDIGMRMLKPRELARAQGFDESYVLTGTATNQVERIGNSVCPDVAAALVAANYVPQEAGVTA